MFLSRAFVWEVTPLGFIRQLCRILFISKSNLLLSVNGFRKGDLGVIYFFVGKVCVRACVRACVFVRAYVRVWMIWAIFALVANNFWRGLGKNLINRLVLYTWIWTEKMGNKRGLFNLFNSFDLFVLIRERLRFKRFIMGTFFKCWYSVIILNSPSVVKRVRR